MERERGGTLDSPSHLMIGSGGSRETLSGSWLIFFAFSDRGQGEMELD